MDWVDRGNLPVTHPVSALCMIIGRVTSWLPKGTLEAIGPRRQPGNTYRILASRLLSLMNDWLLMGFKTGTTVVRIQDVEGRLPDRDNTGALPGLEWVGLNYIMLGSLSLV